jgi:hypothetical protein
VSIAIARAVEEIEKERDQMRNIEFSESALFHEAGAMCLASLLLLLAYIGPLPAQAWEDKEDNKALGELERMGDWEICQEVEQVCQHAAPQDSGVGMEGLEYLSTVRQALEKRHGGTLPAWLMEASSAIAAHEPHRCPSAACAGVREEPQQE